MDKLPLELLDLIFPLLETGDLASTRLVCKIWSTRVSPLLFREVRVHGCSSSCQKFLEILSKKPGLVENIRTCWLEPEDPDVFKGALDCINSQKMKGLTIQSLDCWPCQDRPNTPLESTLAYLILTSLSDNDIGLKKLVLMKSNCNNAPSLERLADLFPSQLASVEDLGLSLGRSSSFEYPPSSLQFSADFFKNLRTLHLETDVFPATVIWNHVTVMSLRVQHADGLEEFLNRHPGLKQLSLILDPIPPLDQFWKACMTGLLRPYLASDVAEAESIIRPAYLEASVSRKSTYFFTCVLRRVGQRIGFNTDLYKEIEGRIDSCLTLVRNELAVISGEKLSEVLGRRRIQFDVNVVQWEFFDFQS